MSESDPLIRRLADANPVPQEELEGEGQGSSAADLLARVTDRERSQISGRAEWYGRRRWVALSAGLLFGLLAVGLVLWVGSDSPATAAEELRQAAAVAASRPPSRDAGRYLYSKIQTDQLATSGEGDQAWSAIQSVVEQTWIAPNGAGRIRSEFGEARFPGARDRERWEAAGSEAFASGVSDDTFPTGALSYEDAPSLPTGVRGLDSLLRQQVVSEEKPADVGVFIRAGELLARSDAPPELRAALYRVVARLPGVTLIGEMTDPIGRPGTAVAMTYLDRGAAVRVLMIFNEETSELLARELILLERATWVDAEPGTTLGYVAYLETGRTDSTSAAPAG